MVKILPNQQKGTETGKESIWINHSIYKCTKIYTIYKEGAIFCYFLIFCCKEVFAWGGITFSKTELTEVGEAPQCFQQIFNWLCCVRRCCQDNTLWLVRHPAQDKMGPEFHQLHLLLSIQGNSTQTFVNCMQQKGKLYHYFEIVYVKVIFLHVDCCYFVF